MKELLDTLNANAGAFNVAFGFVVAVATVVYAILTAALVAETRRMRQAQTGAELVIRIQPSDTWINLIELVIENVGMGTAYDISLSADPDLEYKPGKHLSDLGMFKHGLRALGPRQSLKTFLMSVAGKTSQIEDPKGPYRFTVTARYRTNRRGQVERRFELDLLHLLGLVQVGTSPLLTIARSIESMKRDLEHVVSGFKRLHAVTYTKEDVDREDAEAVALFRERHKPDKDDDAV